MTRNGARFAFLRSYDIPTILVSYPRLVRAMRGIALLSGNDAAVCIRDLKAGRRWSSAKVNRYGGTYKLATDAWKLRNACNPRDAAGEFPNSRS